MEHLRQTFKRCKAENRAALVTYVTAGFPEPELMPGILLAMQNGSADVIELGVPFTDPIADGPTIQTSNTVALQKGIGCPRAADGLLQPAPELRRGGSIN
ncbi:hypothetical protein NUW58_g9532 [Xylaria curta]|uniref:Uncharacterized protein n=1 Tax=Xylaria curta TaxID=42375 RepID=A0ACC1MVJ9_9PEZI|nr:hypothetical protein NUW58_g9532 [Xylaria curta]